VVALASTGCLDLKITNPNEPDSERALSDAGDVGALISASFYTWFKGSYGGDNDKYDNTPGFFLSNQAFQHTPPWANMGMEQYGRLPRIGIVNHRSDTVYPNIGWLWVHCYRALSALADGLEALDDPQLAAEMGPAEVTRYRAYGRFVQGLAHASVALLYARGFVLDETTDLEQPQELVDYPALMEKALAYFDEAIAIAASASFQIDFDWMRSDLDSQGLVRLAHSYKARFRAQVARTPEEREAVDWNAVLSDIESGIQDTHTMHMDWNAGWYNMFLDYASWYNWTQLGYFMYGMADQSGNVAEWLALPMEEKAHNLPDGRPVLIVTPDLRFPQGASVEEQRANEGLYFRIAEAYEEGGSLSSWKKEERGTWRWSWYKPGYGRGLDYYVLEVLDQPELTLAEMRLLKAEGLYRKGDLAGAASIVNETRTAAGLSPTDASGTNTECVPRLPDGSCGDLWEMLKWEKRLETVWTGLAGANWFFDGRGWGDLWKDTPLQLPVPCQELELLQMTPCNSFGGPGGTMGSPGSTYNFPFEG